MAIQVTGFFENPKTKQLFKSPKLELVPHLTYKGGLRMDVHVKSEYRGIISYDNINKNLLNYSPEITDPYTQLIDALEVYIINDLSTSNPECTFEKII